MITIEGEFPPSPLHVRVKGGEDFAILEPGDRVEVIYRPPGWVLGRYPAKFLCYSPTGRVRVAGSLIGRRHFAPHNVLKVVAP